MSVFRQVGMIEAHSSAVAMPLLLNKLSPEDTRLFLSALLSSHCPININCYEVAISH